MPNSATLRDFHEAQIGSWALARENVDALKAVRTRELTVRGGVVRLQYNPARIVSSGAQIDKDALAKRPCFLCDDNRPLEQSVLPYGDDYSILVNPYPILPYHLTISTCAHTPQCINRRLGDLLELSARFCDFVFFYNGARCGASAPDHAHFQAGVRSYLPMEEEDSFTQRNILSPTITTYHSAVLRAYPTHYTPFFEIRSTEVIDATYLFSLLYQVLKEAQPKDVQPDEEPMMNLLCWHQGNNYLLRIFPRAAHRPSCYYAEGADRILYSPGALDMGGLLAIVRQEDYDRLTAEDLEAAFAEVCSSEKTMQQLITRLSI